MRQKQLKLSIVFLLGLGLTGLQAQETIPATGGNAYGSGGSVSYTIGQMVYTTNAGTNGSAAQGAQQPFEISVVTEIEEATDINLLVSAYPNPATVYLTLEVDAPDIISIRQVTYHLYDINGKLLQSEIITGNQTSIYMDNLIPASYFVKVMQGDKELKTFKIIKN